ncbi:hypothetical protein [Legionella shakespearei]|uniref:Uncharacterized protein n=1 Tax=Legionella shakespearei DSM 23087 TaxID=1122169 RepID=A0A0W0YL05_9GAMM|nr:hypothetical protein [Legionella shakespearei]KTD57557.1 hypothetical protein Lsha_2398 [Legionella shakespearei DSM 23087]
MRSKIMEIINNMPVATLTLCNKGKDAEGKPVNTPKESGEYLISDHLAQAAVINSPKGEIGIASWNMWCPTSRLGPVFGKAWDKMGYVVVDETQRKEHIVKAAQYIVSLFAAGLSAMALQEVPQIEIEGVYFELLCAKLEEFGKAEDIQFDLHTFRSTFRLTKEPGQETFHTFGTAFLSLSGFCTVTSQEAILKDRGQKYGIQLANGEKWTIFNHHGDFVNSLAAVKFYQDALGSTPNALICADANIPRSNQNVEKLGDLAKLDETYKTLASLAGVANAIEQHTEQLAKEGAKPVNTTLDLMLSNMPARFVAKAGLENFAAAPAPVNPNRLFGQSKPAEGDKSSLEAVFFRFC